MKRSERLRFEYQLAREMRMSHNQLAHTLSPKDIDEFWIAYNVCPWGEGGETIRIARLAYVIACSLSADPSRSQEIGDSIFKVFYPTENDSEADEQKQKAKLQASLALLNRKKSKRNGG